MDKITEDRIKLLHPKIKDEVKALVEKVIEGMDKIIEKKNANIIANYFVKDNNYYR